MRKIEEVGKSHSYLICHWHASPPDHRNPHPFDVRPPVGSGDSPEALLEVSKCRVRGGMDDIALFRPRSDTVGESPAAVGWSDAGRDGLPRPAESWVAGDPGVFANSIARYGKA